MDRSEKENLLQAEERYLDPDRDTARVTELDYLFFVASRRKHIANNKAVNRKQTDESNIKL